MIAVALLERDDRYEPLPVVEREIRAASPSELVSDIANGASDIVQTLQTAGVGFELTGVGVSIGGHVDYSSGRVMFAHDVIIEGDHWSNEPLGGILEESLGIPAVVDNDVNCMLNYYLSGQRASELPSAVAVYIPQDGYGVGSAISIEGQIVRGSVGGAGELGHVVVQPGGPRCMCGNRGCLQALVGTDAILRRVNVGDRQRFTQLSEVALEVARGDKQARRSFEAAGRSFGQGLSVVVNMLNPAKLLLGGPSHLLQRDPLEGTGAAVFMAEMKTALALFAFSKLEHCCDVEVVELTLAIAAQGAAQLAAVNRDIA